MYQVLLVDDEPIVLAGIKFSVDWQKNDCIVIGTASNGMDALKKIDTLHPDIVLCDIKMPIMDGMALNFWKQCTRNFQILFLLYRKTSKMAANKKRKSRRAKRADGAKESSARKRTDKGMQKKSLGGTPERFRSVVGVRSKHNSSKCNGVSGNLCQRIKVSSASAIAYI